MDGGLGCAVDRRIQHGHEPDCGITTALQYLPILFLGPYGGVIADRISKRKILYFTQSHIRHPSLDPGRVGGNRSSKGLDGLYPGLLSGHDQRL
jgi:hypothetical protein